MLNNVVFFGDCFWIDYFLQLLLLFAIHMIAIITTYNVVSIVK